MKASQARSLLTISKVLFQAHTDRYSIPRSLRSWRDMPADAIAIFDIKQDGSTRPTKKQKVTLKRPGKLHESLDLGFGFSDT